MPTDNQLQLAIAKMLPEKIEVYDVTNPHKPLLRWKNKTDTCFCLVVETEWEHIVRSVEITFDKKQRDLFVNALLNQYDCNHPVSASWQQRATAILKVKGVEV